MNTILKFIVRVLKFLVFRIILIKRCLSYYFLKLITGSVIIREIQGSKMYLDLKDKGISSDLALDGIREPESTKMIQKILRKGNIVVDIGANIGYYALMESRLVGKDGTIYAIEPSPTNIEFLNKNIKLNNCKNIDVYQIGMGSKEGLVKMYISPHSNLNSLIPLKNKKIIKVIDINTTRLDTFLEDKRYPDLIRMDVEGYEYNIIKGMKNTLKVKKPLKLFIELHPHVMKKEQTVYVLKTLVKYGFETIKVIRSITVSEMKVMAKSEFDFSSKTIRELLRDEAVISGKKGAFEIFFERK